MDPMTDPLDREIARALAVDPSPQFVARVRTRIAEQPPPASWRIGWMFAALAAAGVIALAVVLTQREVRRPSQTVPLLESRAIELPTFRAGADPRVRLSVDGIRRAPSGGAATDRSIPTASRVLVDAREVAVVKYLVAAVSGGRVDPQTLDAGVTASAAIQQKQIVVAPIPEIVPIAVQTLDVLPRQEGVRP